MSIGSRRAMQRMARAVDRSLVNCEVEFGGSTDWHGLVYVPEFGFPQWVAGQNIIALGIFADYYDDALEMEGHQPSISIPSLYKRDGTQFNGIIGHEVRVSIRLQERPEIPRQVFEVRNSQPGSKHRTLHYLKYLGPSCADVDGDGGYGVGYGAPYGQLKRCVSLEMV